MRTTRLLPLILAFGLATPLLVGAKKGCAPIPVEPLDLPHCVTYEVKGSPMSFHAVNVDTWAEGDALLASVGGVGSVLEGTCASIDLDCTFEYAPVCGDLGGSKGGYGNLCALQGAVRDAAGALGSASATWTWGECGGGAGCFSDGDCMKGETCQMKCEPWCKMAPPADPACCTGVCVPAPDQGCAWGGAWYSYGESFPAGDGCNTCTCSVSGVGCTKIGCPPPKGCEYNGTWYAVGDTFWAADGCNTCTCGDGGFVGCTKMGCVGDGCWVEGTYYEPGKSFPSPDGCNTCVCQKGGMAMCTLMACAPVCSYGGKNYEYGETFPSTDGCNTCTCMDGGVACTEMACACDPKSEWWRKYVGSSPEQCMVIKYTCEPNTTGFSNACGCGCEQDPSCPEWFNCMPGPGAPPCDPAAIAAKCPYSGIAW
ncbi:MAG: hypothetical protein AMXMBFR64_42110 [Myxococcales bacterium]